MELHITPIVFLILLVLGILSLVYPLRIALLILRIPEFILYKLTKEKFLTSRNRELFNLKNSEPIKIPPKYPLLIPFVRISGIFAILMFLIYACILVITI